MVPHFGYPSVIVTHDGEGEGTDLVDVFEPVFGFGDNTGVSCLSVKILAKGCEANFHSHSSPTANVSDPIARILPPFEAVGNRCAGASDSP